MLAVTLATTAFAQDPKPRDIVVATRVLPPLVVEQKGALTGFSIELWNAIAARLKLKTNYVPAPNVGALLEEVRSNKAEIGVAAISITAAREVEFEFSQPILNAGLQIMVARQQGWRFASAVRPARAAVLEDQSRLARRRAAADPDPVAHHLVPGAAPPSAASFPSDKYLPGIFYAMYWSAATLATQAENQPRQWLARIVSVFWMFTGIVFVALYTAQLTATLTVQQIQGGINGPDDLAGRKVATTRGSTAANIVRELRAQVVEVERIDDAYKALNDREVDAVVFDSPVLLYYAANEGKGRVMLIGTPFRKEDYGIIFRPGNPLRRQVNATLLQLREDGTYQQIYDKWFTAR